MSVFILSGPALRATVSLDGPLAPPTVDSGKELLDAGEKFKVKSDEIGYTKVVDFEHLHDEDDDDDDDVEEEEPEAISPDDPDATEKRRERREKQRQAFIEAKKKREEKRLLQQKKVRDDGEPFVYTAVAPRDGWYRVCVQGTWYQVSSFFFWQLNCLSLIYNIESQTYCSGGCRNGDEERK